MRNILRTKNFYLIFLLDILFIIAAYFSAYLLRFEGNLPASEWERIWITIPYILILKLFIFGFFGLYKGMWRYTGLVDLSNVIKATLTSSAAIIAIILFLYRFEGFSRSVFVLDWILTFILIGGTRVGIRLILFEKDRGFRFFSRFLPGQSESAKPAKRLLIIGAGDAGEKMLRETRDNPGLNYEVIGLLDDDPKKKGMNIHGVTVLGPISQVQKIATLAAIDEILIAMPSASAENMRRIIELCEATGLKFRTTPAIGELINGKVSFNAIREVSYEDLLGRDPVSLDLTSIGGYLRNGVVLISGAGGSIGSELCRQIAEFSPKNLILLDKTENNLFNLEMEFRQNFPQTPITPILGDVQHKEFLTRLFFAHRPGVVFHAAAYKHVPIVELNPWQGVLNNIIGTKNIIETAHRFQTNRFIMVSTDKAVRPSSVMGATKRVAEMITAAYAARDSVRFSSVRFGNVIGSEGSVIHLFRNQIKRLGPVTVTHPEISRYFMTISEACKLILQAGALGTGGEIFFLNMGTPIKILDMARDLIRLSGFKPEIDIGIKFIGLRPGEKLHEELITEGEGIVRTAHEKILVLRGNYYDPAWLNENIQVLQQLALAQNASGIKAKLQEMIPEYQPFDLKSQGVPLTIYPASTSFTKSSAGSNGSQMVGAPATHSGTKIHPITVD